MNWNNVFDTWSRHFDFDNLSRTYDNNNTNVYAPAPYRPRLGVPWTPNTQYNQGMQVDPINIDPTGNYLNTANGYVYVCKTPGISGTTNPFSLNDSVTPAVPVADGTNGLTWLPQAPLSVPAIQITVKYLDPTQNLLRQVTIVEALTQ